MSLAVLFLVFIVYHLSSHPNHANGTPPFVLLINTHIVVHDHRIVKPPHQVPERIDIETSFRYITVGVDGYIYMFRSRPIYCFLML